MTDAGLYGQGPERSGTSVDGEDPGSVPCAPALWKNGDWNELVSAAAEHVKERREASAELVSALPEAAVVGSSS